MNDLIIIPQQPNQYNPPYEVIIETKFTIRPMYQHNVIQEAIMKGEIIPKASAASNVLSGKLREYIFDLIRTNHL